MLGNAKRFAIQAIFFSLFGSAILLVWLDLPLSNYIKSGPIPKPFSRQTKFMHDLPPEIGLCVKKCLKELKATGVPQFEDNNQDVPFCGKSAFERGYNQSIVSYSFYGQLTSKYYNGIEENLEDVQKFYPDWIMRLYLDPQDLNRKSKLRMCNLTCNSSRFDLCSVRSLPGYGDISNKTGTVWRFLPLRDPLVGSIMSRDLDSRISDREKAAVEEWLESGLPFHIMRDSPDHGTYILAGMWGARISPSNRKVFEEMTDNIVKESSTKWKKEADQPLLTRFVWPKIKDKALVHDSYLCKRYPSPHMRPWPTKRNDLPNNFVGSGAGNIRHQTCPKECRPPAHPDWEEC